ncbi:MAG: hypothetical protein BWY09_01992 [Candidatus Hydrogenedentes bacterium ADurb.Bin179]|nr:MAG: hypothetical protein BWY09_01992 [Candidatus Hydrogenedentes bacterium ADurb.Bin179]
MPCSAHRDIRGFSSSRTKVHATTAARKMNIPYMRMLWEWWMWVGETASNAAAVRPAQAPNRRLPSAYSKGMVAMPMAMLSNRRLSTESWT